MFLCSTLLVVPFLLLALSGCYANYCDNYKNELELLKNGTITYDHNFEVRSGSSVSFHIPQRVPGYDDCLGAWISNDKILLLSCRGKEPEKPGCFEIVPSKSSSQKNTADSNQKEIVCGQLLYITMGDGDGCAVGVKTRDDKVIVFKWLARHYYYLGNVPDKNRKADEPPPRY